MLVAYFDFCSNVPLNNTYKNAVHFTTNEERIAFFQNYIKISTGSNVQYNFNFKPNPNSLTTSIVFNFEGSPFNKKTIYNINYILVHQNLDNETEPSEGYYFVTGVRCIRKDVVEFSLELDVMTTYPYGMVWNTNNQVFVERKHCNRFRAPYKGVYYFDSTYTNTGDELDSRFKGQYPIEPIYFTQNKNPYDEDEQISNNLTRSEVYAFIEKYQWEMLITSEPINGSLSYFSFMGSTNYQTSDPNSSIIENANFNFLNENITYRSSRLFNNDSEVDSNVYVYLYPKYKDRFSQLNMRTILTNIEDLKPIMFGCNINGSTKLTFIKEPQLEAVSTAVNRMIIPHNFIYSILGRYAKKGSVTIPSTDGNGTRVVNDFIYFELYPYTRDSNMINIIPSSQESDETIRFKTYFDENDRYQCQIFIRDIDYANEKIWLFENDSYVLYPNFTESDVRDVNAYKSYWNEPKLYKPPYTRYILNSILSTSEGFELNPLVVNGNKISVISKFTPTPSLTRFSYFIKPIEIGGFGSPYNYLEDVNVGVISTMDYSLPIKTDKYWETISEKRNFAISGLATPVVSSLLVSGGGIAVTHGLHQGKSSYESAMGASVAGALIGGASAFASAMNYMTTVDNLINAPDSVKNTGNDALSDFGLNIPLLPFVVKYEMTETQKKQVFDYYYMYGYKVSSYFNLDECFGRQRFNYIKTMDDELFEKITPVNNGALSNEIRSTIQAIFNKGVTMWETPYAVEMSIEYENTEK